MKIRPPRAITPYFQGSVSCSRGRGRRLWPLCVVLFALLLAAAPVALAAPTLDDGSHIVQPGETLSAIARRYGVSQQALMQANAIENPALIFAGQSLAIPGAGPAANQPTGGSRVHIVQGGETLSAIASRYGVSMATLAQANGIDNPSQIQAGQRLIVAAQRASSAMLDPGEVTARRTYVVRAGDTLAAIAQRHGVSLSALAAANGVHNPSMIYLGQTLTIPDGNMPLPAPQAGLRMTVSISQQRCLVFKGEQLLYDWACSTGRAGAGTRTGVFYVQSKIREAWGSAFGFYMPYWLGIYWAGSTENGIHGLPYAPGGQPVWGNAVGTPVTYGCVLLGEAESRTLWEMAYIGMSVAINP